MNTDLLKLLFDFGLMVLIWLVQLIIYPSFLYYQKKDLVRWHTIYTGRLGYVVIPLMLGQLILSILNLIKHFSIPRCTGLILVVIIWLVTFLLFVPLHSTIASNTTNEETLKKLIQQNWWRTFLWTLVFVINFLDVIIIKNQ